MPTNIDRYLNQIRTAVYGKQVRSAIADGIEECYNRDTQDNPLIVRKEVLATEFNANNNYTKGEFVFYEGDIYIFTADHSAGAWKTDNPDAVVITLADAIEKKADKADTVLDTTLSRGRKANTTVGLNSFAFGNNVEASGESSHAEGSLTQATNTSAHAEGYGFQENGLGNQLVDRPVVASGIGSHAEGKATKAIGNAAHSEGDKTEARGLSSHAEGAFTSAVGEDSHAEGNGSLAYGDCSHAEGESAAASGESSHAEGYETSANGDYSHAEGSMTIATDSCSHAEGKETEAFGYCAHSEGRSTRATGYNTHAEGFETVASNNDAHAEGANTVASGADSHAQGSHTEASGDVAHAEGYYSVASGSYCHAEGSCTISNHRAQHVFGECNIADNNAANSNVRGTYVEIIGNGANTNNRSNARTLDWNGNERLAGDLTLNMGTNNEVSVLTALTTLQNQMADLLYEAIKFNSCTVTPSLALIGTTVSSVTIAWDLNKLPTTLKLDNIAVPSNKLIQNGSIEKTGAWTATTTFTMAATDERDTAITSKPKLTFTKNVYYGVADLNDNPNSAFITGLTAELRTNKKLSFTVNVGSNKYVYYAVPTSYGACTFAVGGFSGGFEAAKTVSVTYPNTSHTENYYVYRSTNNSLGSTTITVS